MMTKSLTAAARETTRDTIDLVAVLDMLWRSWTLIAKTAGAVFAMGLLYAWLGTPVYESRLLVQIQSNSDSNATQLLGSLSAFLGVKSSDEAEMQILGSRRVIGAAVETTRYYIQAEPARFPLLGRWIADGQTTLSRPGLFGLGGYAWGNESIDIVQFDTPRVFEGDKFTLIALGGGRYSVSSSDMAKAYTGQIGALAHIQTDAGNVLLNVSAIHANPGTRFKLYRYSRQQTISDLQQRLVIVDKAKDAGVISVALQSAHPQRAAALVKALGAAYVSQGGEQKAQEAEQSLAFLEQQLPDMKQNLRNAEDALLAYRNRHGAIDLGEEAKLSMGQVIALQTRISLLQQERQAKLQQLTPKHPEVISLDLQIATLQKQVDRVDARIRQLPDAEQDVVRLARDVKVNSDLYVAMLNSMQQLRLVRAGNVASVRVVDDAELPEQSIWPKPAIVIGGALVLGILLGLCIALARSLWRGSVTDPHDIEQRLDVPVHATIPHSKSQARNDRLGWRRLPGGKTNRLPMTITHPHEPAVEGLRGLNIALQLRGLEARNGIVLITSATQDVGKSFVAANLAVLLAKAGKRVLLIDGDLRKGSMHRTFNVEDANGLTAVLRGQASLAEAVQSTSVAGLSLLTTGVKVSDSAELLQSAGLKKCLHDAAAGYDIVLIDTAPLLPVADTLWLVQQAGSIYVVARYGVTSEGELIEATSRLARVGVECDGLVLNGVRSSLQGGRYGQYGGGSYGTVETA
ncbi:hypothetical protein DWU98_10570 [Dyella monticola]|uniref:Tyrosine protein kinase n=1 Tax=Dyella monticola TaxID=1927958 RepID=A0A370WZS0_9GAMM|nr:polysaccharide biosynthesis tyrosine autokinase [Dyella monticola]RDS81663.1 hypothetical protein DWU98_10570 [Dyella monticola]